MESSEMQWLPALAQRHPLAGILLGKSPEEQTELGYFHTLREICQQPFTWVKTAEQLTGLAPELGKHLAGISGLTLTGSGSSEYAGHCVRPVLQEELGIAAACLGGGEVLLRGGPALPPGRPGLVVSLARSGDSPESVGAAAMLLESEPEIRHLVLTCNRNGALATRFREDRRVMVITLEDRTNDRSLVMTSSFTNLVLSARFLGMLERRKGYEELCGRLSRIAQGMIEEHFETFHRIGGLNFERAVYLGNGARHGAAREGALKMLEMTAGRVGTMSETYLGFRHGPMTYVNPQTLIVCFLSSGGAQREYELDLIEELNRKKLGLAKAVIGERIPAELAGEGDVLIECPGLAEAGDDNPPVIEALASQLLAFFRCLKDGLRPDSPSENGVINRVVQSFRLHGVPGKRPG